MPPMEFPWGWLCITMRSLHVTSTLNWRQAQAAHMRVAARACLMAMGSTP